MNLKKLLVLGILLVSLPLTVACSGQTALNASGNGNQPAVVEQAASGNRNSSGTGKATLAAASGGLLSDREISDLMYMREEEKLAHDVYAALYARWNLPVFNNIAGSELTHTDTVLGLLNAYGIADPAEGLDVGRFNDPDLQALYDQLVEQGSISLGDALKVGAAIEEIDILDLQEAIGQTGQADIQQVYDNLMQGSYNHLRAFVSSLQQQTGETYQPQYLSEEEYQSIIEGSMGNGMGNSGQASRAAKDAVIQSDRTINKRLKECINNL